jgi:hypothetical protein
MKPVRLFLTTLLLALLSSFAFAQTEQSTPSAPLCVPKPFGLGTYSHVERIEGVGVWSVHYCPHEWEYKPEFLGKLDGTHYKHPDIANMSMTQVYNAYWSANITLPITHESMAALYAPALKWAIENRPPRWIIKPIAPATTRPLYLRTSATTIGAATGETAGAGLHCLCNDPATRVVTAVKTTYCPVASGQPADRIEVAVCSKVNP